jgi:hypothetical protein
MNINLSLHCHNPKRVTTMMTEIPQIITINNGTKSAEDWKGRESRDKEEASVIWHGGCC